MFTDLDRESKCIRWCGIGALPPRRLSICYFMHCGGDEKHVNDLSTCIVSTPVDTLDGLVAHDALQLFCSSQKAKCNHPTASAFCVSKPSARNESTNLTLLVVTNF